MHQMMFDGVQSRDDYQPPDIKPSLVDASPFVTVVGLANLMDWRRDEWVKPRPLEDTPDARDNEEVFDADGNFLGYKDEGIYSARHQYPLIDEAWSCD